MFRVGILLAGAEILLSQFVFNISFINVVYAGASQQVSKKLSPLPKSTNRKSNGLSAGKFSGRGGYSFTQQDTINTYGDTRSRYGAALSLRDPQMDRQSNGGPFDQGFFFDSAITPRGGEAPYLN